MNKYHVLIIDDEEGPRKVAIPQNDPVRERVVIKTAKSKAEALDVIKHSLVHAAFCDIRLTRDDHNLDGLQVLSDLRESRPFCRRFLMTQWGHAHRDEIFKLLRPGNAMVEGLVDKSHYDQRLAIFIAGLTREWLRHEVTVRNLDQIVAAVQEGGLPADPIEIDCAISSALGQGEGHLPREVPDELMTVELNQIAGGRSGALVFKGRPALAGKQDGIWIVTKLGRRDDCQREIYNYQNYVRWTLSLNRRVELLSYELCDNLGVVCYTFAHATPENVTSLEKMIGAKDETVLAKLDVLFRDDSKEWYATTSISTDMGGYFFDHYGLDPNQAIEETRAFLLDVCTEYKLQPNAHTFRNALASISLPVGLVGGDDARADYHACIVHGDLNAANIIVAIGKNESRVALIDFSDTGPGPASLDFAVLQTHLRQLTPQQQEEPGEMLMRFRMERRIWEHAQKDRSELHPHAAAAEEKWPYWARISCALYRYCRANFPNVPLTSQIAVYVLWVLRMTKVPTITRFQRMRLIIWMGALLDIYDELKRPARAAIP